MNKDQEKVTANDSNAGIEDDTRTLDEASAANNEEETPIVATDHEDEELVLDEAESQAETDEDDDLIAFVEEDDDDDAEDAEDNPDGDDPIDEEAEKLRAELEAANQRVLRAVADFENYKRRSERERSESIKFANKNIFQSILNVLDNFERALDSAPDQNDNFVIGVKMIRKQLLDVLLQNGVEEVEAIGKPFDPYMHEAFAKEETDAHPDNTVVEVYQRGFKFHGTLLRPAKVKVAMAPEEPSSGDATEPAETND